MNVFVDTSALYALLDRDDARHHEAAAAFPGLLDHDHLLTHNYVVVETTALCQSRLGPRSVRVLVEEMLPAVETVWVTPEVHSLGMAALLAAGRRRLSLVDWVSFEVIRRTGADAAFAFDDDFAANGHRTVP